MEAFLTTVSMKKQSQEEAEAQAKALHDKPGGATNPSKNPTFVTKYK